MISSIYPARDTVSVAAKMTPLLQSPSFRMSSLQYDAPSGPSLADFCCLLRIFHEMSPEYKLWQEQCYWFCNSIMVIMQGQFPTELVLEATHKRRGNFMNIVPMPSNAATMTKIQKAFESNLFNSPYPALHTAVTNQPSSDRSDPQTTQPYRVSIPSLTSDPQPSSLPVSTSPPVSLPNLDPVSLPESDPRPFPREEDLLRAPPNRPQPNSVPGPQPQTPAPPHWANSERTEPEVSFRRRSDILQGRRRLPPSLDPPPYKNGELIVVCKCGDLPERQDRYASIPSDRNFSVSTSIFCVRAPDHPAGNRMRSVYPSLHLGGLCPMGIWLN